MVLMNQFEGQQQECRHREETCRQSRGRRECDQLRESSIDTYTLPYVNQIANGGLLYNTGSSTWCSVTSQRGGIGWGVGERIQRLIQTAAWQKSTQHCYTVTFQLQNFFLKSRFWFSCRVFRRLTVDMFFFFFFYLYLHWVFVAAQGFSCCGQRGLLCSCVVQASHCSDFPCCRAWAQLLCRMQAFPGPGSELMPCV